MSRLPPSISGEDHSFVSSELAGFLLGRLQSLAINMRRNTPALQQDLSSETIY
jgi:hypothetical protein